MRKPPSCMCKNKGLCFRYTDGTIPLLPKSNFKPLAIFFGCTAWFVWDLVGNPEDRFSQNEAQINMQIKMQIVKTEESDLCLHCLSRPIYLNKLEK